jgi:HD-GYP domain-containing protein (c-di-GMP phosphodiesterase class II)
MWLVDSFVAFLGFPQLEKYRAIVRAHHERVDGRGYPDGLLGSEIPYESRLIAVADSFHAVTVSRPTPDFACRRKRSPN